MWQVLTVDAEDGRPTEARRIDPTRVTFTTDLNTQEIVNGFYIEGGLLPITVWAR
jgi:hypothetical protein